jgi:hypothetical protein
MKSFRRISLGYFVALAAAALLSASTRAEVQHNKAVVRAIRGTAQISNDKGSTWKKASVGARLDANSIIKTDAASTADLFLGENGPVVRVTEDTRMGIDRLDLEKTGLETVIETQLDLKNGRILGNVKKMAAASKYEVKTPVGVAGIRGTEYSIDARGKVTVVQGTVVVVYVVDNVVLAPVTVGAGQTVTPPPNAQTAPVVLGGGSTTPGSMLPPGNGPGDDGKPPVVTVIVPGAAPGGTTEGNPNGSLSDPEKARDLTSPNQPDQNTGSNSGS